MYQRAARAYSRRGRCLVRAQGGAVAEPPVTFAGLLRKLRTEARLTQEELAEASGVRPRSISDLERGVAVTPQRETIRRLADALNLTGPIRAQFEAVARGRSVPAGTGAAGVGGAAAATRTLPRDVASFTGRQQELRDLVDAAAGATQSGGVVSIHAIGGMAGIGKTAFAVHAAHRLADRFPAGQIFLPLHGHTPGQQPVNPGDALASLLLTAGVPAAQIPAGVEARMALWRDRLAERQLLLILDDAASSEQVLPLLPGVGGRARQPARLPGPGHRYRPARSSHSSHRRARRTAPTRRSVGRCRHTAHGRGPGRTVSR
jgi:transcriptional regulator with XRE-family HTH domain